MAEKATTAGVMKPRDLRLPEDLFFRLGHPPAGINPDSSVQNPVSLPRVSLAVNLMRLISLECQHQVGEKFPFDDPSETHKICRECVDKKLREAGRESLRRKFIRTNHLSCRPKTVAWSQ